MLVPPACGLRQSTEAVCEQGTVLLCRSMNATAAKALHSLLYALNLSFSYLLMLAVMTYNAGYFFVIVLGLALGNFVFGGRKSSDICHSQA